MPNASAASPAALAPSDATQVWVGLITLDLDPLGRFGLVEDSEEVGHLSNYEALGSGMMPASTSAFRMIFMCDPLKPM
jgi:hypothetical protein